MKNQLKKFRSYIGGVNGVLLILYSVFIFLTAVITSDYFSSYYFLISFFFILVLAILICPLLLRSVSKLSLPHYTAEKNKQLSHSTIIHIALYIIPLAVLLIYYLAYYPGSFSIDSIEQYSQAVSNQYNDWHPVIQTLFAFKLPLTVTGGWIGSIVLFQIICFSAILGYSFNTVLEYTNVKYIVISMAFVLLNPQLGNMAIYPWKDVSFAMGTLLLLVYSLKVFLSKGEWIKKPLNTVLFIVVASLTTLFRHNALLFTVPLVVAILFYLSKKRGLVICLSIILLCMGIKYPLYSAIGVESPDKRQVETLGLPMTVIGAVVTYSPDSLDEETREFAYKVAPKEVWAERYKYGSYNFVKWDDGTNNDVIEEYGSQKVILMMLKSFNASKRVALISLIKLTEASFSVTGEYDNFVHSYIEKNEFGLSQSVNGRIAAICEGYSGFVKDFISYPFLHLGFLHLLLIIAVLSKCKLNKLNDWKKILFVVPVFAYNFGTSVLLTGVEDASRFFFYTFLLMPVLFIFTFNKENIIIEEV